MRAGLLALALLAACAPAPSPTAPAENPPPAPDPLAVQVAVSVDGQALAHVAGLRVTGPDIAVIEVRTGADPSASQWLPGRVGPVLLDLRTNWAAGEQTIEMWRRAFIAPSQGAALAPARRPVAVTVTQGGASAVYAFERCTPEGHVLDASAQGAVAVQSWRIRCEAVTRTP
ncbi:MAG: hypothetical protein NW203_14400 [Hyphomonadaceae bacterium]|nr:hypothetical protein [Hyphomonadaceae bacterium]